MLGMRVLLTEDNERWLPNIMDWLDLNVNTVRSGFSGLKVRRSNFLDSNRAFAIVDEHCLGVPNCDETAIQCFWVFYDGLSLIGS